MSRKLFTIQLQPIVFIFHQSGFDEQVKKTTKAQFITLFTAVTNTIGTPSMMIPFLLALRNTVRRALLFVALLRVCFIWRADDRIESGDRDTCSL